MLTAEKILMEVVFMKKILAFAIALVMVFFLTPLKAIYEPENMEEDEFDYLPGYHITARMMNPRSPMSRPHPSSKPQRHRMKPKNSHPPQSLPPRQAGEMKEAMK